MRRLLWVGDAGCPSGFARATHETLDVMRESWDVTVLGINYRGDPHSYPYPMYTAMPGGDAFGLGRLIWMMDKVQPDVVILQNDPWNIRFYTDLLKTIPEYKDVPVIAAVAVDGLNCRGSELNDLTHAIFWTQFGLDEARKGGYRKNATIVPLGVDTDVYRPIDRHEARRLKGLPKSLDDVFIVGNVNRNQPRKRLDLTIRYFASWVNTAKISDAYLYLHVAPTGDIGFDVKNLMEYYGVKDRLILMEPAVHYGVTEEQMVETYNCFDVQITTTQGEGFGLTTFEGMACGIPQIVPNWAALGELVKGAAWMVPCTSTCVGPPYVNVLGGVVDENKFIDALHALYTYPEYRTRNSAAAIERANEPRYRWKNVAQAFTDAVELALDPMHEKAWSDLGRPEVSV